MRWIIAVFLILDVQYQMFAQSKSVNWSIFYDSYHYATIMAICIYQFFKNGDKLLLFISGYFFYIITIQIYNLNQTREIYLAEIRHPEPLYNLTFSITLILIIYIYEKNRR